MKAHRESVEKFMSRVQDMVAMLVRVITELDRDAKLDTFKLHPPEQLPRFKALLQDATRALEVHKCMACIPFELSIYLCWSQH